MIELLIVSVIVSVLIGCKLYGDHCRKEGFWDGVAQQKAEYDANPSEVEESKLLNEAISSQCQIEDFKSACIPVFKFLSENAKSINTVIVYPHSATYLSATRHFEIYNEDYES